MALAGVEILESVDPLLSLTRESDRFFLEESWLYGWPRLLLCWTGINTDSRAH